MNYVIKLGTERPESSSF